MKKIFILILSMLMSCLLIACDSETTISTIITTENTMVSTTEVTTLPRTPIDVSSYVEYRYDDDITEHEKAEFELDNQYFIQYLAAHHFLDGDILIYKVNNNEYNHYASHTGYIHVDITQAKSFEGMLNCILSLFDEYTNYGLLVGLTYYIGEEVGSTSYKYFREIDDIVQAIKVFSNQHLTDLTYPCFVGDYTLYSDKQSMSDLAVSLSRYIIQEYSLESLLDLMNITENIDKFQEKYLEYINSWLNEHGSNNLIESKIYPVSFSWNIGYEMAEFKSEHATWLIEDDYRYGYFKSMPEFDLNVTGSYAELIETIQFLEGQMTMIDPMAKSETVVYKDLTIKFTNVGDMNYYFFNSASIFLITPHAFLHEYIHHITVHRMDFMANSAKKEWLAVYFSRYYELERETIVNEMNFRHFTVNGVHMSFADIFEDHYGREFDIEVDIDNFYHMKQYLYDVYDDSNTLRYPYNPVYSSVSGYLMGISGEDNFWLIMEDLDLLDDLLGVTWDEFYINWKNYVIDNYSWLDEYIH